MGNVLDPRDQTMFDLGRATGATILVQCAWVYNRPIDIDGLRQFHDHLQRGRLSRRIERSPLPFGRHRWVSPDGSSDIEIVASADRVKNSTPGSTSRPTPHWIASTDLDGTLRCSRSPTAAPGWALSSHIASPTALGCVKRWRMRRPRRPDQLACRRIAPAVAGPARGRPPNRARHPRYRPRRRRRGTVGSA